MRREERLRSRRRRQSRAILVAGLIIAILFFVGVSLLIRSGNSDEIKEEPVISTGGDGDNVLLVATDGEEGLSQLLLLTHEGEGGYSIYTIPVRTIAADPEHGFRRMDEFYALGGRELLGRVTAELLRVPVDYYVAFDNDTIELLAKEAGIINFKADAAMRVKGSETVLSQGDNLTSSDRAVSYLETATDDPDTGPQVQAMFYRGVRDSFILRTDQERSVTAQELVLKMESNLEDDDIVQLFVAMTDAGQPFGVWPLPVTRGGSGDDWYLEPIPDRVEAMIQGSNLNAAFNMEVRNGTETEGLVEEAAAKLEPLRYNMVLNLEVSGVNYDHTQIRCGSEALGECKRVKEALGAGTIIKDEQLEQKQIIVIIGRDLGGEEPEEEEPEEVEPDLLPDGEVTDEEVTGEEEPQDPEAIE